MGYRFTEAPEWRAWVTPQAAREKAIHRWYLFPHSFTGELVQVLIDEWGLKAQDCILDPFVGAGTTLLAAKERRVPSIGYDLSPLAVLSANTKVAAFSRERLETVWHALADEIGKDRPRAMRRRYAELVEKALPGGRLAALDHIAQCIEKVECSLAERDFFRLALVAIIQPLSCTVANGGWLRWRDEGMGVEAVVRLFEERVGLMLAEIAEPYVDMEEEWRAHIADARKLPEQKGEYTAVITSPPYPNRHDYTRVFGVELMFAFLDWKENRDLRRQSFHSHPEARPRRPVAGDYVEPTRLNDAVCELRDPRIQRMLRGYFLDMHLCLGEVKRVCHSGAMMAFVLGNVRYDGRVIRVDEFTAELGERVGLECCEIRTVRWRGNSAQQMGRHGRVASRESIVMFRRR